MTDDVEARAVVVLAEKHEPVDGEALDAKVRKTVL